MDLPPAHYSAQDPWREHRLKRLQTLRLQIMGVPGGSLGGLRTGTSRSLEFSFGGTERNPSVQDEQSHSRHYRGVFVLKPGHTWLAKIKVKSKTWHLGQHTNEIEAAQAYDSAAWFLRGPKATLNFPRFSYEALCPSRTPPSWVISALLSEVRRTTVSST